MTDIVEISGLVISYRMTERTVRAIDDVDLTVAKGETLGIVGESGSGKSTLGMAIGRLLSANAEFEAGWIRVHGQSIMDCTPEALRRLRHEQLGFVFQNPMSALDPTMRIGKQVALALSGDADRAAVEGLIARVGLDEPRRVAQSFPHELSGGMAQRVVIGLAIARDPSILIADEPTASLDTSIQDRILELLLAMREDTGASLIVLSHDLRMIVKQCDRVAVMYGGRLVELGKSREVFAEPRHPYTQAMIKAAAGNEGPDGVLEPIPGVPPVLHGAAGNCAFAPRCRYAESRCRETRPPLFGGGTDRLVACHLAGDHRRATAQDALA